MFKSLVLISCFLLTVESITGQILPTQNVSLSLRWINDFCPELSWTPLPDDGYETDCEVMVKNTRTAYLVDNTTWSTYTIMEGGFLSLSLQTSCGVTTNDLAVINASHPELVKDLQCYIYSASEAYCSWSIVNHTPDFGFYYELTTPDVEDSCNSVTQECSEYSFTNGVKTGCYLRANTFHSLNMLFNGTVRNTYARNTFQIFPIYARPPPLKLSIEKNQKKLNISWNRPDVKLEWTFEIKYTVCNESKNQNVSRTYEELIWNPHCPYRISVKANHENGETEWSEEKYLEPEIEPPSNAYLAVLIPLMVAFLVALTLGLFWRFKKIIFPEIPQPKNLLAEFPDNNNKTILSNMNSPAEEEESCKITLVVDPQMSTKD